MKKLVEIPNLFVFLEEQGFCIKKYLRAPDEEYVYQRNGVSVWVGCYSGITDDYRKVMCVDVIISEKGNRKNLLDCTDIFDECLLMDLSRKLQNADNNQKLRLFAQFLGNNINNLLR